ncbi:HD-domain/PDEase-like protein [Macrolepiota fuliginosa MF-IS2]|uniref:Phosphodiesterase n=1 Tax=Macrolepiota fuliginosa MF-IS2 TaxID=1400762 RepID=A0A9P6C279_9AGAR|nr:HD-domain/PDEase-like protein [Macrolepiota fuliginosa MF-IS2]
MLVSDAVLRRRSADVGGLHLAMRGESQGQGWLDSTGSVSIIETKYAELLTTMYRETCRLVESNAALSDPPELSAGDRERLLKSLDAWYFEPLQMPEDEVLACVLFFFQVLFRIEGMKDAVKIDMNVIPRFVLHIRQLYRWQNHYHNFEHAVDVLQAIHCYLRAAGMVPPVSLLLTDADAPGGVGMWKSTREPDSGPLVTCLTPHEIFALYLAAIGHDVAHPGLSNLFMQNAETPLSQVYDNQSALEQMHSYLLLTTMRHHGMGVLLDDPQTGTLFRKILKGSVLATDMGVHQAFMDEFAKVLDGTSETSDGIMQWRSTKCFRQIFVCQVLLKNADISNPCRPFLVSKQWASALQQEWSCQYKFENFLQLQHSVNPSNGLLAEANSQVYFTRNIAKPLVDLTTIAIPELRQYSYHCAENLRETPGTHSLYHR